MHIHLIQVSQFVGFSSRNRTKRYAGRQVETHRKRFHMHGPLKEIGTSLWYNGNLGLVIIKYKKPYWTYSYITVPRKQVFDYREWMFPQKIFTFHSLENIYSTEKKILLSNWDLDIMISKGINQTFIPKSEIYS